ncbi:MAG: hypothetical protein E8D47_10585 [Nitrospira sp.]|nr:MAG: hypothetical protein E8D47_10585 [Nitrospira sp.]
MGAGDSNKGLYDHLYRRFFENRARHKGYDFQHAPGGSNPTPGVTFPDRLRWWAWGRWKRRQAIMAARDRFQLEGGEEREGGGVSRVTPFVSGTAAATGAGKRRLGDSRRA